MARTETQEDKDFQKGQEFQDFCMMQLRDFGIYIQFYGSRKNQYNIGESCNHIEVKLDEPCSKTHRLSIEIAERKRREGGGFNEWVKSGIYRNDNSIWYLQGNYDYLALFEKRILVQYHKQQKRKYHCEKYFPIDDPDLATGRAFYVNFSMAAQIATQLWTPDKGWHMESNHLLRIDEE
jgi:hypothetical protein